ncbi:MAG: helix-turn-helix domain-containing protein, partial [Reyranellales bacterium]
MARSHPVDIHVGARVRQRRTLLGMSQTKLGDAVGLTFQQIQKYERGSNRIGSSRLFEFAKVLDVPVSHFFDEMPSNALAGRPMGGRSRKGFGEAATPFEQEKDPLIKRETLELVRAYYKIREPRVRKRLFEMVKAVGAAS